VAYAASLFENAEVEIVDMNAFEMPIYKHQREVESGVPQEAKDFAAKIDGADLFWFLWQSITELILQHSKMCSTGHQELKTEQYGMKYQCY
jgi:hypothetical protein